MFLKKDVLLLWVIKKIQKSIKNKKRAMLDFRQTIKLESKGSTSTSMLSAILDLSLPRRLDLSSRDVNGAFKNTP